MKDIFFVEDKMHDIKVMTIIATTKDNANDKKIKIKMYNIRFQNA
jgi:hypothetical protein